MSRLLVTGAASFTARHVFAALADGGERDVVGTDLAFSGPAGVHYLSADLTDRAAASALLETVRPRRVLHLAGAASRDAELCWRVNLGGTRHLLEAAARLPDPPYAVVVSSSAVYGVSRPDESPVGENTPLRPLSAYGVSKAAGELTALSMDRRGELPVAVARPFNLIGPGLGAGLAPADFLARIAAIRRGEAPPVLRTGNLTPVRDYLDARDAARGYLALLAREDLRGRVFNFASERGTAIRALVDAMLEAAGVDARVEEDPSLVRAIEVPVQVGNAAAAREVLGWTAEIPLRRSAADMAATLA